LTENGLARILSQPSYPNHISFNAALEVIAAFRVAPGHEFWPDEISLLDMLEPTAAMSSRRVTDVYLLGLAAHKGGKLATFDRRIPAHAVRGGPQALELITA
jgi:predicted nucleic acid-binding protein